MKVKCKNCGYEREHLGENEDYECPLCNGILNEIKKEFFNDFEKRHMEALRHDIDTLGADKVWNIIEGFMNPLTRINYRNKFFQIVGKNYEVK